jgi:hypothetical protein
MFRIEQANSADRGGSTTSIKTSKSPFGLRPKTGSYFVSTLKWAPNGAK